MDIAQREPAVLEAGTTWKWDRDFPEFPAKDGWTVTYALRGPAQINLTTTNTSAIYQVRVTPTQNGAYLGGHYTAVAYAEKAGEKYRAWEGHIRVLASIDTADGLTFEERTLNIIKTAIEGRLTADLESYEVAGRAVTKIPIGELHRLAGVYANKVWRQRNPGQFTQTVEVSFGRD